MVKKKNVPANPGDSRDAGLIPEMLSDNHKQILRELYFLFFKGI